MLLALPTCSNLPDWEVDDQALFTVLDRRGVTYETPIWDDPAVDWSRYDAVLIRTTWDYQEKLPTFVNWVREASAQTRLINPPGVVEWNTHKTYLRDLAEHGAVVTPTLWLDAGSEVDLKAALNERGWTKAFIKPMVGATARETLRFEANERGLNQAMAHLARLLPTEGMMIQPYVSTVETDGELSAIYFGGRFSHGVQKIPVLGDYRVQEDFGAKDVDYEFSSEDLRAIDKVFTALDAVMKDRFPGEELAYGRVDFLRAESGQLWLNELELVEPSLFFRRAPASAERLADVLLTRLG